MAGALEHAQEGECEHVGEPMPDIAGTGILLAFVAQAFLSLGLALWIFVLSHNRRLDLRHEPGSPEYAIELKRLESAIDILMVGNDIQMLTGLALMITAFVAERTTGLDLYHLHLVYDTVSFVGVSNAAALVTWTFCATKHPDTSKYAMKIKKRRRRPTRYVTARHRTTYLFALIFLALAVLLLVRLGRDWSTAADAPPRSSCYRAAGLLAVPSAAHPAVDQAYVAVTATWLLAAMLLAVWVGPRRRYFVMAAAALQFPVHLYAVAALRTGNQALLEAGHESENRWDFGQTTAVLLLLVTLNEFVTKVREAVRFEKGLRAEAKARRREGAGTRAATAAAAAAPAAGEPVLAADGHVAENPAAKQATAAETRRESDE